MNAPALLHVAVEVPADAEEPVVTLLETMFASPAVTYHDLELDRRQVSVYVPAAGLDRNGTRRELARRLAAVPPLPPHAKLARISLRRLKPTDWAESWKRHFRPIEIPGKLLIKPSWNRRQPRGDARLIVLDPGLSFGTGQHPTTRFCLEQLSAARRKGRRQSFLDIGTGTGILALAAAKLGYRPVEGLDFDPAAIRSARENAARNELPRLRLRQADLTRLPRRSARKFSVICANLTHDLLVEERHRILGRLAPGGLLVLAGILTPQFATVEAAYRAAGLRCRARRIVGEWCSGVFGFDGRAGRP